MIDDSNIEQVLLMSGFERTDPNYFKKIYRNFNIELSINTEKKMLYYPAPIQYNGKSGFEISYAIHNEYLVVFECIDQLLSKGYRPEDIELERTWTLGHENKGGRADICVKDANGQMLTIIECKTSGKEYDKELKNLYMDGGQLFSYWQQERSCKWLVLYASDCVNSKMVRNIVCISCNDDENLIKSSEKNKNLKLFRDSFTAPELFKTWDETYEKRIFEDVLFRDDSVAYQIGVKPLRKKDLIDISEDAKIVEKFEEILRHNNISDRENAFNRLIALFICKLVDEIQCTDSEEVQFQYKLGTDTFESLQDRLQYLHKTGMEKFMREDIFYISDTYVDELVQQYSGDKREHMVSDLKNTIRQLKFYSNNHFSFKDVHNEELFYQNSKVLVEIVQLFEKYRIINSGDIQSLGKLFENLLINGFKQNEGQFFTPVPITHFVWNCLPLSTIMNKSGRLELPKIIDYSCGAGHFLTEGHEAINDWLNNNAPEYKNDGTWVKDKLYGIEKDYRLATTSRVSLFMHGAGEGNIIFGDGLENYFDKGIIPGTFDILVANPPFSIKNFKQHLKLNNNTLKILEKISENGDEIELTFVERAVQLVKQGGYAAIILPDAILNNNSKSHIKARKMLLMNFKIDAIVSLPSGTFGQTASNTVILYLHKYNEPPIKSETIKDTVHYIVSEKDLNDWIDLEIKNGYLSINGIDENEYHQFLVKEKNYTEWSESYYFNNYLKEFKSSSEYRDKIKQSSFMKKIEEEKTKELNELFYNYAIEIEKRKLYYYALTYDQKTLLINRPSNDKEKVKFLGYKWSNGKIQEIKSERQLYNPDDRMDPNKISGVILSHINGSLNIPSELSDLCIPVSFPEMLDFEDPQFNLTINVNGFTNFESEKSVPSSDLMNRIEKLYEELKICLTESKIEVIFINDADNSLSFTSTIDQYIKSKFNELFDKYEKSYSFNEVITDNTSLGRRFDSSYYQDVGEIAIVDQGKDLICGYLDKQDDCEPWVEPSIIFGDHTELFKFVDFPFYLGADGTKLLSVSKEWDPMFVYHYLKYNYHPIGGYRRHFVFLKEQRFSKPPMELQLKFTEYVKQIDKITTILRDLISEYDTLIKSRFIEQFGDPRVIDKSKTVDTWADVCDFYPGTGFPLIYQGKVDGKYPLYKVGDISINVQNGNKYLKTCDNYVDDEVVSAIKGTIIPKDTIVFAKIGEAIKLNRRAITTAECLVDNNVMGLKPKENKADISYFYVYLSFLNLNNYAQSSTPPSIKKSRLERIKINLPELDEQKKFAEYVKQIEKRKFEIEKILDNQ